MEYKSLVMSLKKDVKPRLIILQETYKISEQDIRVHGKWAAINEGYRELEKAHKNGFNIDWEDRAIQSVINSIVYQQRVYCCITKRYLRNVVSKDKNWIDLKPAGLPNKKKNKKGDKGDDDGSTHYKFLLAILEEKGILELFDKSGNAWAYKVIHPALLQMIKGDSEETQKAQVLEFIKKNNKENGGARSGARSGALDSKKERKQENQTENDRNENGNDLANTKPENKIPLSALLAKQLVDWPSFEETSFLAQMAVENCADFDGEVHDQRQFRKYLEGMKGKLSKKQKDYLEKLTDSFGFEARKHYNLLKYESVEISEPTKIAANPSKIAAESEDFVHSNTLSVLKTSGNNEHLRVLKRKLEKATTEERKAQLAMEIKFWEGV